MAAELALNVNEEEKLCDVRTKMKIVKSLLKVWSNKANVDLRRESLYHEITKEHMTQYMRHFILEKKYFEKNKTFQYYERLFMFKNSTTEPDGLDKKIRDIIVNYHVHDHVLLNKTLIIEEFRRRCINTDEQEVEKLLRTRGYSWKMVPNSRKGIIVEDPDNSFNRIEYLHKIQQFRQAGMNIVYIEDRIITKSGDSYNNFDGKIKTGVWIHLAVSSTMGVLSRKSYDLGTVPANDNRKCILILNWILDDVLPQLSTSSVIVLDEKPYYSISYESIPSEFSYKSDMMKWLEKNNIPYHTNMHSAELHELIEASKHNFPEKVCDIENNLSAYGHKTLLRPCRTHYDHFVNDFLRLVFKAACRRGFGHFVELFDHFLSSTPISHWQSVERAIIASENQILADDIRLDDILENLFLYLQKGDKENLKYLSNCDDAVDETRLAKMIQI